MITHTFSQTRPSTDVKFYGAVNKDKLAALRAYQAGNPHITSLVETYSADGLTITTVITFASAVEASAYFSGVPANVSSAFTTDRNQYCFSNGIILSHTVS